MLFNIGIFYVLLMNSFATARVFGNDGVAHAAAQIRSEDNDVNGIVTFEQEYMAYSPCIIRANITGIPGEHGFAILDWGNMVGGCDTMGNTFNPDRIPHSSFEKHRHRVGTLGNIINGQYEDRNNRYVSLYGRNSVLGRGIAIFENPDDGAQNNTIESRFNGNVGTAIACGIIARMDEQF